MNTRRPRPPMPGRNRGGTEHGAANGPVPESGLLAADEPAPFEVVNASGAGPWVLVCDHASQRVPRALGTLGLPRSRIAEHIGWDPGAAAVARGLAARLDAPLVLSAYSRLVVDCNRPPESPESVPEASCGVPVPGNQGLSEAQRAARRATFFEPYHAAISALLDGRGNVPTLFLSVHSFTAELDGTPRPWPVGICSYREPTLARTLQDALRAAGVEPVGVDQPYAIEAAYDHGVPVHGEGRGLPSAMVELRQDELRTAAGIDRWTRQLAEACDRARQALLGHRA
jgi:predicted N-formylglutamate amidohydrolase